MVNKYLLALGLALSLTNSTQAVDNAAVNTPVAQNNAAQLLNTPEEDQKDLPQISSNSALGLYWTLFLAECIGFVLMIKHYGTNTQ